MGWKRMDLGGESIWEAGRRLRAAYWHAVAPIMEGPRWSAAAIYVNAGDEAEKTTIWLSPKAVELMEPLPAFVDCDGPRPGDVEQFLGAGDDFDPLTVELPDDLRPQVIYPAIIEHWIAHEIGEIEFAMSAPFETVTEFPLRA